MFLQYVLAKLIVIYCARSEEDIQRVISILIVLFGIYAAISLIETFTGANYFDILFHRIVASDGANPSRLGFSSIMTLSRTVIIIGIIEKR